MARRGHSIWPFVMPFGQIFCKNHDFLLVKLTVRLDGLCQARLIWIIADATNRSSCASNARRKS